MNLPSDVKEVVENFLTDCQNISINYQLFGSSILTGPVTDLEEYIYIKFFSEYRK